MVNKKVSEFRWAGISPLFHYPIVFNFIPHELARKIIVDGGCGKGIYGFLLRATRDLSSAKLIGIDVAADYLDIAKRHKIYDNYLVSSLEKLPLKDKSVDVFLAVEVISHLTKKKGLRAIREIDRVCRERAIIVVPNSMRHCQPEFIPSDSHHSEWGVRDFKVFGYKVYGFGLRIPPPKNLISVKLYFALQYIATPFSYFFPDIGGYLVAIKQFSHGR